MKTILAIAAVAAIAGWMLVRMLNAPSPRPNVAPERKARARHDSATPAGVVRPTPAPVAAEPANEQAGIVSDLDVIAEAVHRDVFMENFAFPADRTALDLPSLIQYTRAEEFWQPAFEAADEDGR